MDTLEHQLEELRRQYGVTNNRSEQQVLALRAHFLQSAIRKQHEKQCSENGSHT